MNKVPTMEDIAVKARVSITTVSRAYSDPERVSVKTKSRIFEVAQQLGYTYTLARHQKSCASSKIKYTLVLHDRNNQNQDIFTGIEEAAHAIGHKLIYVSMAQFYSSQVHVVLDNLINRVQGILLINCSEVLDMLETHFTPLPPLVVVNDYSSRYSCVYFDYLSVAFQAFTYLKRRGHQHIACVLDKQKNNESVYIQQAYFQSLMRDSVAALPTYVVSTKDSIQAGIFACLKLLNEPIPPTAIFCQHENVALGILHQARKNSIQVPQQLSIMTMNHSQQSKYVYPALSAVNKSNKIMGRKALYLLLKHIKKPNAKPQCILLEADLIIRQSTL